jgi:hypothetical protein
MQPKTALTIIPGVLMMVGLVFVLFPEAINNKLFLDLDGRSSEVAAILRRMIGVTAIGLAIVLLSCRELTGVNAKRVLLGFVGAACCIGGSIIAIGVTGTDPFPTPPVVMFFVLIALALVSARKID